MTEVLAFEWECRRCDAHAYVAREGGLLNWDCACDVDTRADGHDIHVYAISAANGREHRGTLAAIGGRKPGEPSKSTTHRATCTDPACTDWAHKTAADFEDLYAKAGA